MSPACPGETTLLILALDTTTRAGSVAVLRDGDVLAVHTGEPAITHGERLPADLHRALTSAGVPLEAITLLAVASGPGSFTGLRVGIAAIQGLAFARALRVVPVSTLEALAHAYAPAGTPDARLVAPWMDAQRGQVFAALYAADGHTAVLEPTALPPAGTLDAWRDCVGVRTVAFVGDGALRYRDLIDERLGAQAHVVEPTPPLAPAIARLAEREPARAVLPHAIVPLYVRRPDAELARDARRS